MERPQTHQTPRGRKTVAAAVWRQQALTSRLPARRPPPTIPVLQVRTTEAPSRCLISPRTYPGVSSGAARTARTHTFAAPPRVSALLRSHPTSRLLEQLEAALKQLEATPDLSEEQRKEFRFEIFRKAWSALARDSGMEFKALNCRVQSALDMHIEELERRVDSSMSDASWLNTSQQRLRRVVGAETELIKSHTHALREFKDGSLSVQYSREATDLEQAEGRAATAAKTLKKLAKEHYLLTRAVQDGENTLRCGVQKEFEVQQEILVLHSEKNLVHKEIENLDELMTAGVPKREHEKMIAAKKEEIENLEKKAGELTNAIKVATQKIDRHLLK